MFAAWTMARLGSMDDDEGRTAMKGRFLCRKAFLLRRFKRKKRTKLLWTTKASPPLSSRPLHREARCRGTMSREQQRRHGDPGPSVHNGSQWFAARTVHWNGLSRERLLTMLSQALSWSVHTQNTADTHEAETCCSFTLTMSLQCPFDQRDGMQAAGQVIGAMKPLMVATINQL